MTIEKPTKKEKDEKKKKEKKKKTTTKKAEEKEKKADSKKGASRKHQLPAAADTSANPRKRKISSAAIGRLNKENAAFEAELLRAQAAAQDKDARAERLTKRKKLER
jgi:hypothetical protein